VFATIFMLTKYLKVAHGVNTTAAKASAAKEKLISWDIILWN